MSDRTESRGVHWDDVPLIHELVRSRWPIDGPKAQMRIGDFWWSLRNTPDGDPLCYLRLWTEAAGRALAFAWLDPPAMGDLIVAPDAHGALFHEALDWIEAEHRGHGEGSLSIVVIAGDDERRRALERRGYVRGATGNVRFWRTLERPPDPAPLAPSFELRHVVTGAEIQARVFVERAAFEGTVTADAWRLLRARLPGYVPELDLIAVAADGTGASACTCWYDEPTRCGEVEAVGTALAYRRMGLSRAVIVEGLRRLHRMGARSAVVQTTIGNTAAIALYPSCGFEYAGEDLAWVQRR